MKRVQRGFSVIELMVSLIAGLIVSGAVLAFTVSSLQANTEYVRSTRLTQNLREVIDYASRELRRAGYDQYYMDQLSQTPDTVTVSPFAPIFISEAGDCVIYAVDFDPDNDGTGAGAVNLANGEIRAMRLVTATVGGVDIGVIETARSDAGGAPACDDDTADYVTYPAGCTGLWCPLSDPRAIDVTEFTVDRTAIDIPAPTSTTLAMQIRELAITISAALSTDADVVRTVNTRIKVRADCVRNNLPSCAAVPTGT
jgi:prepilin-type N-terminal cleavage/methylation domain-containing protein